MNVKEEWKAKGFIDEPVDEALDLKQEIRHLCREKDAIILAHYYTMPEIQDIADFVGDSLALAREAAKTEAKVMVMCGVHSSCRSALHGRDSQGPLPRKKGADTLSRGGLLAGRQLQGRGPTEV